MNYKEIKIKVNHEDADIASYVFIENGSEGVSVIDANDVLEILNSKTSWDYYDKSLEILDTEQAVISGGFAEDFDEFILFNEIEKAVGYSPKMFAEVRPVEDWSNSWKDSFSPMNFGKVVVVPVWLDGNYDKTKVLIDPGMGFGTGLHESTGMCLKMLSRLDLKGKSVIDIGCGSGILGIAASKLGSKNTTFIDIDEQAIASCKHNMTINNVKGTVIKGNLVDKCHDNFDVVLANLTADILIGLSSDLKRILKSNAIIILSGVISERKEEVISKYVSLGFSPIELSEEGDWVALSFGI